MPPTDGHCCEARRIIRRFVDGRNTEGFQSYLDAFQDVLFAYMDSELTEGLNTSDRQHNAMLLTAMNRLLYDVAHYLHRRE